MDQPVTFKQWYQDGQYFVHRSHPVFYRVGGHGGADESLLLLHGFPTSSWDWHHLWPRLCERFSTVIAADLIGFGHSSKPRDFDYRIHDWADLQERLLSERGVSRYHIISHNIGNNIAQELLARQHERRTARQPPMAELQSICFISGGMFAEIQRPTLMPRLLNSRIGPLLAKLLTEQRFSTEFAKVFGPDTQPTPDELREFWAQVTCNGGANISHKLVSYHEERAEYRDRWVKALIDAAIPLRLIDGLADPMSGARLVNYYRQLIPNADVVELPHIGHYPHVEAPAETLAAIEAFYATMPTRTS